MHKYILLDPVMKGGRDYLHLMEFVVTGHNGGKEDSYARVCDDRSIGVVKIGAFDLTRTQSD